MSGKPAATCCNLLDRCDFFGSFAGRRSLFWKGLISQYCQGPGHRFCERRLHFLSRGDFPAGQVLPSGQDIPTVFLRLE